MTVFYAFIAPVTLHLQLLDPPPSDQSWIRPWSWSWSDLLLHIFRLYRPLLPSIFVIFEIFYMLLSCGIKNNTLVYLILSQRVYRVQSAQTILRMDIWMEVGLMDDEVWENISFRVNHNLRCHHGSPLAEKGSRRLSFMHPIQHLSRRVVNVWLTNTWPLWYAWWRQTFLTLADRPPITLPPPG